MAIGHEVSEISSEIGQSAMIALTGLRLRIAASRSERAEKAGLKHELSADVHMEAVDGVVEGRYPTDELRPITYSQTGQALRASRRRSKIVEEIHEQERLQKLYGHTVSTKDGLKKELGDHRFTRSEKRAIKKASSSIRAAEKELGPKIDDEYDPDAAVQLRVIPIRTKPGANIPTKIAQKGNPEAVMQRIALTERLDKSSKGEDIPGRVLGLRTKHSFKKAARLAAKAEKLAIKNNERIAERASNRSARQVRKQQKHHNRPDTQD